MYEIIFILVQQGRRCCLKTSLLSALLTILLSRTELSVQNCLCLHHENNCEIIVIQPQEMLYIDFCIFLSGSHFVKRRRATCGVNDFVKLFKI